MTRVAVDYFPDMGVPIFAGSGFVAADTVGGGQAAIVDREFVEQALGGGDALGRRIRLSRRAYTEPFEEGPWLEIVGVVPNFAVQADLETADARIYLPASLSDRPRIALSVRVPGDAGPGSFATRLREITTDVDPDLTLIELRTGTEAERRLRETVLSIAIMVTGVVGSVLLLSRPASMR